MVILNMLTNVVMFVPHVLLENRFGSGMMSAVVAVPVSMALLIVFTKQIQKVEGFTLSKMLQATFPTWIRVPFLVLLSAVWMTAGAMSVVVYTEMTRRFLSPETSSLMILTILLLLVIGVSYLESDLVMYGVEVLFIFVVPVIVFLLGKALFSKSMNWLEVSDIATHLWSLPDLKSVGAATFLFSGFVNMAIFGRHFPSRLKPLHYWMLGVMGLSVILTSFLIPIGFLGSFSVERYAFPWMSTADSMRMEFFFIERVVGPFLLLYLILSTLCTIVTWHVGCQLIDSLFSTPRKMRRVIILAVFSLSAVGMQKFLLNEHLMYRFTSNWLVIRLAAEFLLIASVVYGVRRWKKSS
ncbi:hypothetical protein EL26_17835 [Tumebacillus flagellatus]|uniref:Uncharacterized protein n=1 Tax=Tumebacillus flagellatus TaxID=1157490 RepID=A0A074LLR8_9BACL|nr:hypothetical protein EL26_17835 [Tumebacillus flagellatus]